MFGSPIHIFNNVFLKKEFLLLRESVTFICYGKINICENLQINLSLSGFARIFGYPVGIIGNNGVLFSESAKKVNKYSISFFAVEKPNFWWTACSLNEEHF